MDANTLIGTLGALVILHAFVLNQSKKWNVSDFYYDLSNFVGSAILTIYAIFIASYPFLILNLVWAGISLKDVILGIQGKSN